MLSKDTGNWTTLSLPSQFTERHAAVAFVLHADEAPTSCAAPEKNTIARSNSVSVPLNQAMGHRDDNGSGVGGTEAWEAADDAVVLDDSTLFRRPPASLTSLTPTTWRVSRTSLMLSPSSDAAMVEPNALDPALPTASPSAFSPSALPPSVSSWSFLSSSASPPTTTQATDTSPSPRGPTILTPSTAPPPVHSPPLLASCPALPNACGAADTMNAFFVAFGAAGTTTSALAGTGEVVAGLSAAATDVWIVYPVWTPAANGVCASTSNGSTKYEAGTNDRQDDFVKSIDEKCNINNGGCSHGARATAVRAGMGAPYGLDEGGLCVVVPTRLCRRVGAEDYMQSWVFHWILNTSADSTGRSGSSSTNPVMPPVMHAVGASAPDGTYGLIYGGLHINTVEPSVQTAMYMFNASLSAMETAGLSLVSACSTLPGCPRGHGPAAGRASSPLLWPFCRCRSCCHFPQARPCTWPLNGISPKDRLKSANYKRRPLTCTKCHWFYRGRVGNTGEEASCVGSCTPQTLSPCRGGETPAVEIAGHLSAPLLSPPLFVAATYELGWIAPVTSNSFNIPYAPRHGIYMGAMQVRRTAQGPLRPLLVHRLSLGEGCLSARISLHVFGRRIAAGALHQRRYWRPLRTS